MSTLLDLVPIRLDDRDDLQKKALLSTVLGGVRCVQHVFDFFGG